MSHLNTMLTCLFVNLLSELCLSMTMCHLSQGCLCSAGNVEQQGAVYVVQPGGKLLYSYVRESPADYPDMNDVFNAAGMESDSATVQ
jgi:hypothetical protein